MQIGLTSQISNFDIYRQTNEKNPKNSGVSQTFRRCHKVSRCPSSQVNPDICFKKKVTLFLLRVACLAAVWGLLCGWVLEQIVCRIIDPLAEVTLVISGAYIAYFAGETWLLCSGVITVVAMGK